MTEDNSRLLDPRPARRLTSREVCKVLGGVIGGMAMDMAGDDEIFTALEFILKHRESYAQMFRAQRAALEAQKQ